MSLQLQSVHLSLGGRPVVQGVTLELQPGEVVGLLGPNGAGKTTTISSAPEAHFGTRPRPPGEVKSVSTGAVG